ncbi:MAG: DUF4430 domain-containing protein [Eubacterium sp.]|nr:DUF4430 domain-containing protein [Eubacterium sp.]
MENYIPSGGYLLRNYKCKYKKGDSVYDVLKRAASECGIHIYSRNTEFGVYVSEIGYIEEGKFGATSGWTYYVNGEFPMLSCALYEVKGGDKIVFKYVCS